MTQDHMLSFQAHPWGDGERVVEGRGEVGGECERRLERNECIIPRM